jgi:hypothetical protein
MRDITSRYARIEDDGLRERRGFARFERPEVLPAFRSVAERSQNAGLKADCVRSDGSVRVGKRVWRPA